MSLAASNAFRPLLWDMAFCEKHALGPHSHLPKEAARCGRVGRHHEEYASNKSVPDRVTSVNGYFEIVIFQIKKVPGCTPRNVHFENFWIRRVIQNTSTQVSAFPARSKSRKHQGQSRACTCVRTWGGAFCPHICAKYFCPNSDELLKNPSILKCFLPHTEERAN